MDNRLFATLLKLTEELSLLRGQIVASSIGTSTWQGQEVAMIPCKGVVGIFDKLGDCQQLIFDLVNKQAKESDCD